MFFSFISKFHHNFLHTAADYDCDCVQLNETLQNSIGQFLKIIPSQMIAAECTNLRSEISAINFYANSFKCLLECTLVHLNENIRKKTSQSPRVLNT